jgi:hypothetical protein
MRPVTHQNLGVVIAYLLPGSVVLWPLSLYSSTLRSWLGVRHEEAPTVGGFLYVTLAALGLGILTNSLRALVLDPLQHRTGIKKRLWSYSELQHPIGAIEFLVVHQFRYYQFSGNTMIAALFAYAAFELHRRGWSGPVLFGMAAVQILLWFSSRATLRTYYQRLGEILSTEEGEEALPEPAEPHETPDKGPANGGSTPVNAVGSEQAA